jgi:hypothetical protein
MSDESLIAALVVFTLLAVLYMFGLPQEGIWIP